LLRIQKIIPFFILFLFSSSAFAAWTTQSLIPYPTTREGIKKLEDSPNIRVEEKLKKAGDHYAGGHASALEAIALPYILYKIVFPDKEYEVKIFENNQLVYEVYFTEEGDFNRGTFWKNNKKYPIRAYYLSALRRTVIALDQEINLKPHSSEAQDWKSISLASQINLLPEYSKAYAQETKPKRKVELLTEPLYYYEVAGRDFAIEELKKETNPEIRVKVILESYHTGQQKSIIYGLIDFLSPEEAARLSEEFGSNIADPRAAMLMPKIIQASCQNPSKMDELLKNIKVDRYYPKDRKEYENKLDALIQSNCSNTSLSPFLKAYLNGSLTQEEAGIILNPNAKENLNSLVLCSTTQKAYWDYLLSNPSQSSLLLDCFTRAYQNKTKQWPFSIQYAEDFLPIYISLAQQTAMNDEVLAQILALLQIPENIDYKVFYPSLTNTLAHKMSKLERERLLALQMALGDQKNLSEFLQTFSSNPPLITEAKEVKNSKDLMAYGFFLDAKKENLQFSTPFFKSLPEPLREKVCRSVNAEPKKESDSFFKKLLHRFLEKTGYSRCMN